MHTDDKEAPPCVVERQVDMATRPATIRLVSHEGESFVTDILTAKISGYIKEYLKHVDIPVGEQVVISLPVVRSPILSKILAWAQHHRQEEEKEEPESRLQQGISPWDAEFLNMDDTTLLELTMMAYFLDIDGLLRLTAAAVAKGIMMGP